jgi:hypothetical protein
MQQDVTERGSGGVFTLITPVQAGRFAVGF